MTPDQFAAKLDRLARDGVPSALRGTLGELGRAAARRTPGVSVRTGRLRDSVEAVVDASGGTYQLRLRASGPQARILEQGGTILPKRGRFLTVRLDDGSWRRPERVTIRARHYLATSLEEARRTLADELVTRLKREAGM